MSAAESQSIGKHADRMSSVVSALCSRECLCASGCTSEDPVQHCDAYPKVINSLNTYFKLGSFRPGQLEA